ncbi:MAG: dihydrofolate reductase [Bacteroidaceae bacterium]|nr:dihydrofolate reductase [Bacteroidaceae bacterium]
MKFHNTSFKKTLLMTLLTAAVATTANATPQAAADQFPYNDERFADLQMLRYQVPGFNELSLRQKTLVYCLNQAALYGRDILWDQNGRYNLRIRQMLETVYTNYKGNRNTPDWEAFVTYLKRVWFSNGIHHHYGCDKFQPGFSQEFLRAAVKSVPQSQLPITAANGSNPAAVDALCDELFPIMFDPTIMPKRVNQADGQDLILTSAENYYGQGVTQAEAEAFYTQMKEAYTNPKQPIMFGMNSRLVKENGQLKEKVWRSGGLYGPAIDKIIYWLKKALLVAESEAQKKVINKLIEVYQTSDLKTFDKYTILWVNNTEDDVDFTNYFTESYGDPLGMKASWEAITNFKDHAATERTRKLSDNAQWFEDNSPVDARFKKEKCKGISAKVIVAAILGGDLYPSTAIGINLPNSNWVRAEHGSKSVTIGNLTDAYNKAAHGNGFQEEFVIDQATQKLIDDYGDYCDDLHTDLHECLGHGSGKLLPGVDVDSLKAYGSTIEEGRADLFALYYLADPKLVELGLTPAPEAYQSQYYTYLMNGLLTQLVRIEPGKDVEEAHMRNRAFIANWVLAHAAADSTAAPAVQLVKREGKTYVQVNNYPALRKLFGTLLAEVQRIKSEGDFDAARNLVETYGVKVDPDLHAEILARYKALNLAPYKGFINPKYELVKNSLGIITDVKITYDEPYDQQMLRYSSQYRTLPYIND